METILSALKAIGEPTRMRVMALCAQSDLTVSELVHILGQSQPRVSRHLKLLCEAGLLQRLREGSWVFHRLPSEFEQLTLAQKLVALIPQTDEIILRDKERLAGIKQERAQKASEFFNRNANDWEKIRALHIDDAKIEQTILELCAPQENQTFLDIGTATGRILELIGPHIQQGWGIDLSLEMLNVARANLEKAGLINCAVRQGDMYQMPFSAQAFDLITIHQVLHFAETPSVAIGEAARLLKDNGKLLIVDFAPHEEEDLRSEFQHRRLGFSDDEILRMFDENGLYAKTIKELPGTPITVKLWLAEKTKPQHTDAL